jgi:SNF2 family DNA or RNA helicase
MNKNVSLSIVITSYDIAMKDCIHLSKIRWKYIIIDEGENDRWILLKTLGHR